MFIFDSPRAPSRETNPELAAILDELDSMVGLEKVKKALYGLVDTAQRNYKKELEGVPVDDVVLNRLFLGNPGTGKTTVAGTPLSLPLRFVWKAIESTAVPEYRGAALEDCQ